MRSTACILTFLAISALASPATAGILHVPGDQPTIQDAVLAASPGDTLLVAAGSYLEQICIQAKDLTIEGAGSGQTVIVAPLSLGHHFPPHYYSVVHIEEATVHLHDLTVDGAGHANGHARFSGVGFYNAGGSLQDCEIANLTMTPVDNTQTGAGVYSMNTYSGGPLSIALTDVTIHHYQKSGIALYGGRIEAVLTRVSTDATLLPTEAVQNGIETGLGATATLVDCHVRGHHCADGLHTSVGILSYYSDAMDLSGTITELNQSGYYSIDTDLSATNCVITGLATPPAFHGITAVSIAKLGDTLDGLPLPLPFTEEPPPPAGGKAWGSLTLTDCVITGAGKTDTDGLVMASGWDTVNLTVSGCRFTAWDNGLDIVESSSPILGDCRHNLIAGNLSSGVRSTTATPVDAGYCWWGDVSGPFHATGNPDGLGDAVTDHVLYHPWLGEAALTVTPPASGPLRCGRPVTLDVLYTPPLVDPPGLRGYEVTFAASPQLTWSLGDVTDSGVFEGLAGGSTGHFFRVDDNGDGSFTVTDALLGPTGGLTTEAPLFHVTFHTAATGTATVSLPSVKLRDLDNQDIAATIAGATVEVDCTPPGRVSNIHAEPGFAKVVLTWQDPPVDVATVEIWRGVWHDGSYMTVYPEYDDHPLNTIPTRPASRAQAVVSPEWSLAGIRPAGAQLFVDTSLPTVRGVYYYECFAFDTAGNVGPPALANDRATNYWLGDLYPPPRGDGWIDVADITVLGASFWSNPWDFEYNAECDVGPTDDGTGTGIPLTDDEIDFEDLMVFSLNYNVVAPYKRPAPTSASPVLTWGQVDETTWSLGLASSCPALKGLHLHATLPEGITAAVSEGDLLRTQARPVFLRSRPRDGLELVLALLGGDGGLEGSGELLRVSLSPPAVPGTPAIEARDPGNRELVCELREGSPPVAPVRFQLDQNSPNPFNPRTNIAFSLPEAQRVRLTIFALDGRRVAGLMDERRGPGRHTVTWNGRDDRGRAVASGTYFYRLEAGPYGKTRKMILTK